MYEIPSQESVRKCIINRDVIEGTAPAGAAHPQRPPVRGGPRLNRARSRHGRPGRVGLARRYLNRNQQEEKANTCSLVICERQSPG